MSGAGSRTAKELYEFGPFRVDPEKEVLLRAGEHVPLTPKTFQILLVLVRHSKEVVTKDDLMKAVWPDTFVEETNLTRNVFTLRKALGESEQNRYIITVPGRGYRFAGEVRLMPGQEVSIVAASHSKVQAQVKETKPWRWIVVAVILLSAVVAGMLRHSLDRSPVLTDKDTIVLADFNNSTGEAVFDGTLRQCLTVQLEQSPFLSLISEDRIQHTLRLMGERSDTRLTPELAREICERTGSTAVLGGSIAPLGSQYVLGLRATNCRTGDLLDEEQAQAVKKEDVVHALTQIATRFRARVGESLATVKQHDTPLAEATTPSLEALKAYSAAWKVVYSTGSATAVPFVKRAIAIDPKFAMAYAFLGRLYGDMGESALSAGSVSQAYQLRDRVSDREKFFITALYDRQVTGNLEKARETCELWAQAYPRDVGPHAFLSGGVSIGVGQYEEGAAEAQKGIELDPDFAFGYSNLAANYIFFGQLPQAENTLRRASQRRLEIPELLVERYDIAFLEDDRAGMERAAALSKVRAGAEDWIADTEAYALAFSGHLLQARRMTQYAVELAQQAGEHERSAQYETAEAVREALFGDTLEAKRSAMAALALSQGRDVEYGAAIALARSENSSLVQKLANDLKRRFPEDTLVQFSYLPTLQALLALNDKKPSNAIERLQVASPDELGSAVADSVGFVGALYPVYVRGEAYLAERKGPEAAREFQKILDHRGIVVSDPIGALAHLQFGRAYAVEAGLSRHGKSGGIKLPLPPVALAKARRAYQDFLTLWKHADPDIPVLKQAKAEYARLQ